MVEKLFTADGYRPAEDHIRGLGVSLLAGAAAHQLAEGDYWIQRRQGCFIPNCAGCSECAIRVRPYRDAVAWLRQYIGSLGIYGQQRDTLLAEVEAAVAAMA